MQSINHNACIRGNNCICVRVLSNRMCKGVICVTCANTVFQCKTFCVNIPYRLKYPTVLVLYATLSVAFLGKYNCMKYTCSIIMLWIIALYSYGTFAITAIWILTMMKTKLNYWYNAYVCLDQSGVCSLDRVLFFGFLSTSVQCRSLCMMWSHMYISF